MTHHNNSSPEYKEKIASLSRDMKEMLDDFNSRQNISTENDFVDEYKGKEIVIIFEDGTEKNGKLLDIDKFRIIIEADEKEMYFFKHTISGYFAK